MSVLITRNPQIFKIGTCLITGQKIKTFLKLGRDLLSTIQLHFRKLKGYISWVSCIVLIQKTDLEL